MQIEELRCLIVLADTMSFIRAAEACYMSPASFTRKIQTIEKELGASLVTRTTRSVKLTQEGEDAIRAARIILEAYDSLQMRLMEGKEKENLTLITAGAGTPSRIADILTAFRKRCPNVYLRTNSGSVLDAITSVSSGAADAGFFAKQSTQRLESLSWIPILRAGLSAFVPIAHPWSKRHALSIQEFHHQRIVLLPRWQSPYTHDYILSIFLHHSVSPEVIYVQRTNLLKLTCTIENCIGIWHPLCVDFTESKSMKILPISDVEERFELGLGLREGENRESIHALCETVKLLYHKPKEII